jgi:MoxR-like ATPase
MYPMPYAELLQRTQSITELKADDHFGQASHHWSDAEREAVLLAWASRRPLLIRGEAGCGKSQLARAVAVALGVPLFFKVINPRVEANDLLFTLDPIKRLTQAQLLAALRPELKSTEAARDFLAAELAIKDFVDPGELWRAMAVDAPQTPELSAAQGALWPRSVMLIDEIDKADADVPNALLEVLGNRSFTPPGHLPVRCFAHEPLVLITTNEDRDLPPAFLRRCVVLNLQPSDASEADFCAWLCERAKAHAQLRWLGEGDASPMRYAAKQVWADRDVAKKGGLGSVGLAEFLDLLHAINQLADASTERAHALIDELSRYALVKQRSDNQRREPVARTDTSAAGA